MRKYVLIASGPRASAARRVIEALGHHAEVVEAADVGALSFGADVVVGDVDALVTCEVVELLPVVDWRVALRAALA